MSGILSRWPVLLTLRVAETELDGDGRLTEEAVERLFADARREYVAGCATVDDTTLTLRGSTVSLRDVPVGDGVTISVSVVEIYPETFTMNAMVRPSDGGDVAASATCSLSPDGEVTNAIRDEFIARAHDARYMH